MIAMLPTVHAGFTVTSANSAAPFTRADGTVADHSRPIDPQSYIMRTNANRDDPDLAGHRVTECTTNREAA